MQARRASRELSLVLFSQFDKNIKNYKKEDFMSIILKSVRTLVSSAQDEVSMSVSALNELKDEIIEYENNHPENLSRPIDSINIPVELKYTNDFQAKIDTMLNAAEKTLNALDIAELCTLSQKEDVREYLDLICENYKNNKDEIDRMIGEFSKGWDIERIFKIDKDILRIAIVEIVYIKQTPHKVVIDEALELAKKYSTDDSPSFINGILARVVDKNV